MPEPFLMFRLAGPFASWGDITVGEKRTTWSRPSRSAVLGLVAGALGIDRGNDSAHAALDTGLGFAVRPDGTSSPPRDFHTAQVPSARKGVRHSTRADELGGDDLNTIVSERWYWIDHAATVALWGNADADLEGIAAALIRPHYAPYLGRKACPPSRPFAPRVIVADTLASAFADYDAADRDPTTVPGGWAWTDADTHGSPVETVIRRDRVVSRSAWIFTDRRESRIALSYPIEAGASHVSD
jgi:CRISPR system Cascade subunit CasD